jgi:protein required for attachment to host cells
MAAETPEVLVVVFDGARARFLKRAANGRLTLLNEIASGLGRKTSEIVSDRQGRNFASVGGGIRHPYEPKHDPHKLEKHNFVHGIVKALDDSYDQNKFKQLVVVAPERSLGEFRALASDKLLRLIAQEVPKELTQLPVHELEGRLNAVLEPGSEPVRARRR